MANGYKHPTMYIIKKDDNTILETSVTKEYVEYCKCKLGISRQGLEKASLSKRGKTKDGYSVIKKYSEENVSGKSERSNTVEEVDGGYVIHYGNGKRLRTNDDDLCKAFSMFCVGGMTMNQVSLAMRWTREEFYAAKTAFSITKDSLPFTPNRIDGMSADDIAELTRIEKKRYATEKFNDLKHKDTEKTLKSYLKSNFWHNQIIDGINSIIPTNYHENNLLLPDESPSPYVNVVKITDIHSGLKVDSQFNTYNLEIMRNRFEKLFCFIANNIPKSEPLRIIDCGDTLHGIIHGSVVKNSEPMVSSLISAIECYSNLINSLRMSGYNICFAKANGSHSSIEKTKQDRTDEENLGRIVYYALKKMFSRFDNIFFVDQVQGTNLTVLPIIGKKAILIGHGDEMPMKQYSMIAPSYGEIHGLDIIEVQLGHLHHYKGEKFENGVLVEYTESFCGSDQYATKLGLNSPFGARWIKYNKDGRIFSKFIDLK